MLFELLLLIGLSTALGFALSNLAITKPLRRKILEKIPHSKKLTKAELLTIVRDIRETVQ